MANFYPEKLVNDQIHKIVFVKNAPIKKLSESGILFEFTCHPKINDINKLIKDLLQFLYSDKEVQKVFSPPPIV